MICLASSSLSSPVPCSRSIAQHPSLHRLLQVPIYPRLLGLSDFFLTALSACATTLSMVFSPLSILHLRLASIFFAVSSIFSNSSAVMFSCYPPAPRASCLLQFLFKVFNLHGYSPFALYSQVMLQCCPHPPSLQPSWRSGCMLFFCHLILFLSQNPSPLSPSKGFTLPHLQGVLVPRSSLPPTSFSRFPICESISCIPLP
jgi:hypothetical protein